MATPVSKIQTIYQDVLANYLISMARTVESSVGSALDALLRPNLEAATQLSSKVFLVEPRVNELEILIDDHAVRMLRTGLLDDEEIRRVVASQKIANDLERIGDLAVNISERVISLAGMNVTETPRDLEPMAGAVRAMLGRSLGALIFRNVVLAGEVLEADDVVDRYRDQIFEHLLHRMTEDGSQAAPQLQFRTPMLYGLIRHPIMAGFIVAFWAAPVMSVGHLVFAIATTGYILIALQFEEHDLIGAFGQTYLDYRRRIPMLIPFLRPPTAGAPTGTAAGQS